MAIAPMLVTAIGAGVQGEQAKQTADYNSKVMGNEAAVSGMESNQATLAQLRKGNMALGRQTVAGVESGGGVSGSTGAVLHQSATNAELDALNVRYSGLLRQDSYNEQASLDTAQGKEQMASAFVGGAGGILKQAYGQKTGTYGGDGTGNY
jgi:hypothetical protein